MIAKLFLSLPSHLYIVIISPHEILMEIFSVDMIHPSHKHLQFIDTGSFHSNLARNKI